MTWYERIIAAHVAVTEQVSHLEKLESARYFVWAETGANDLMAGGGHAERAVSGTTDLFTKVEFDPWAEALEDSLSRYGIAWSLVSVALEEETGFIHYSWDWEVC